MSNAPCLKCHNARRSTKVSELTAWLASVCILVVLVVLVVVVVVVVLIVSWQCGYSPWQAQAQWSPARFCTAAKGVLARSANPTAHRQRRSLIAPLPRPALPRLARFAIFEHAVRPLAVHAPTTAIVRKRESGLQTALHCTALHLHSNVATQAATGSPLQNLNQVRLTNYTLAFVKDLLSCSSFQGASFPFSLTTTILSTPNITTYPLPCSDSPSLLPPSLRPLRLCPPPRSAPPPLSPSASPSSSPGPTLRARVSLSRSSVMSIRDTPMCSCANHD